VPRCTPPVSATLSVCVVDQASCDGQPVTTTLGPSLTPPDRRRLSDLENRRGSDVTVGSNSHSPPGEKAPEKVIRSGAVSLHGIRSPPWFPAGSRTIGHGWGTTFPDPRLCRDRFVGCRKPAMAVCLDPGPAHHATVTDGCQRMQDHHLNRT
jgi:hypothetical protein